METPLLMFGMLIIPLVRFHNDGLVVVVEVRIIRADIFTILVILG